MLHAIGPGAKRDETGKPTTTKMFASNAKSLAITKTVLMIRRACCVEESLHFGPALLSRKRSLLSEFIAEQDFCFTRLNGNHSFRDCTKANK